MLTSTKEDVTDAQLCQVFDALGLGQDLGRVTNESKKDKLAKGIRALMDIYFDKYDENIHADLLGEILFNARIFSKCASDKASLKTTRSVSSCIFNVIALLKAIDSKSGALNYSAVDEYAHIEDDSNLSDNGKGKGILRKLGPNAS